MLTRLQAQAQLKTTLPKVKIKAWTIFEDVYLFRVEYPSLLEKDWDPFFSVDKLTGSVRDFSILTDIESSEALKLIWNEI